MKWAKSCTVPQKKTFKFLHCFNSNWNIRKTMNFFLFWSTENIKKNHGFVKAMLKIESFLLWNGTTLCSLHFVLQGYVINHCGLFCVFRLTSKSSPLLLLMPMKSDPRIVVLIQTSCSWTLRRLSFWWLTGAFPRPGGSSEPLIGVLSFALCLFYSLHIIIFYLLFMCCSHLCVTTVKTQHIYTLYRSHDHTH